MNEKKERPKNIPLPITIAKRISGDYDLQAGADAASVIATVYGDDNDLSCWPAKANAAYIAQAVTLHDEMLELLISARCIAQRQGAETAWEKFDASIKKLGIGSITARTYRVLPSDSDTKQE